MKLRTIWFVQAETDHGLEAYYVGVDTREDALIMAAERGYDGDAVTAKEIPNKFGIQLGEWRSAI